MDYSISLKKQKIDSFLQTRGYDLSKIKGYDSSAQNACKALTKQEALEAVELYLRLGVSILGGDVFYLNHEKEINWTYDNWYCNRAGDENYTEYCERSIRETENYIVKYKNSSFKNCIFLFNIVFSLENV